MLAERLKATREKLGMTQSDVCKASGISKGYLSSLEAGKQVDPSYSKLSALARALSTTALYLYGDTDEQPDRTCETCIFFNRSQSPKNPDIGLCRRYPPFASGKEYVITSIDKWCGEWQKR